MALGSSTKWTQLSVGYFFDTSGVCKQHAWDVISRYPTDLCQNVNVEKEQTLRKITICFIYIFGYSIFLSKNI